MAPKAVPCANNLLRVLNQASYASKGTTRLGGTIRDDSPAYIALLGMIKYARAA